MYLSDWIIQKDIYEINKFMGAARTYGSKWGCRKKQPSSSPYAHFTNSNTCSKTLVVSYNFQQFSSGVNAITSSSITHHLDVETPSFDTNEESLFRDSI